MIDEQGHHLPDNRYEKCSWYEVVDGKLANLEKFYGDNSNISLGLFYNIFAALIGLSEADLPSAGKLMGLAPFGRPHPEWPRLIKIEDSGDTKIDLGAIDRFFRDIGFQSRPGIADLIVTHADQILAKYLPVSWRTAIASDLAYKAQEELELAVLAISTALKSRSGKQQLCFAGGIALNCITNARLSESGWDDAYIHPAATDDGAAIGLSYYGWIELLHHEREPRTFYPFTGKRYESTEIRSSLKRFGLHNIAEDTDNGTVAADISSGAIICWFDGSSEWGPRALGARSIIASPLTSSICSILNGSVKFREPFRPFGISITAEAAEHLLDFRNAPRSLAPYMLSVATPKDPRLQPITHIDGTVRYQIVEQSVQPRWHSLIDSFGKLTGVAALVNTSFNTWGEPLVETPSDAI